MLANRYNCVVYWKLELSHNELIIRQKEWFENNKHLFETFWNRVMYYRNNMDQSVDDDDALPLYDDVNLKVKYI